MMEAAVDPGGTAWRAAVPGYRVAGKTGTAQKVDRVTGGYSDDRVVAVFAGFLPAGAPRVVIVVAVDEPRTAHHSGGAVAAPVFAEIGEAAMRYLGVVPTESLTTATAPEPAANEEAEPVAVTVGPTRVDSSDAVPSFLGMTARQVLARYAQVGGGLNLELRGTGLVVQQMPEPGAARGRAAHVTLVLAER
jgi:cell division protein FtsI (penicillin-binding protein 3)